MLTVPQLAPLLIAAAGCVTDLKSRRIPNWLTLSGAAGAFGFYLARDGWHGFGWSAGGWAVGLAMFFPFFLLRGIGGGDIKLVAALGAWVGPMSAVWLALYAAVAGGPLALVTALSRGYAKQAFSNIWGLFGYSRLAGVRPHPGLTLETAGSGGPAVAVCTSHRGRTGGDAMATLGHSAAVGQGESDAGSELVELALALPLVLLVIAGVIDFGFLFQRYEVVTNAAREGARMAVLSGYLCSPLIPR